MDEMLTDLESPIFISTNVSRVVSTLKNCGVEFVFTWLTSVVPVDITGQGQAIAIYIYQRSR